MQIRNTQSFAFDIRCADDERVVEEGGFVVPWRGAGNQIGDRAPGFHKDTMPCGDVPFHGSLKSGIHGRFP